MGNLKKYIKRGIKYILTEHKQPIIKVEIVQKSANKIFENKNYIVTGGGSGIGYHIAKKLIDESAKVIIIGRNEKKLKEAVMKLGKSCDYCICDITDVNKSEKIINMLFEKYEHIDGIINNAGLSLHEWDFMKVDEEGFDKQFYTNLKGSYFLLKII